MAEQESKRVAFETARLRLARLQVPNASAREVGLRLCVQVVADALQADRVGVWMFEDGGSRLTCKVEFAQEGRRHGGGLVLECVRFPHYVAALQHRRALVADDARTHHETRELLEPYLLPRGVLSLLDAPIVREGRVVGVVCHEQVGRVRNWSQREIDFAGSSADIVALILEQADRADLEAALKVSSEQRAESRKLEALGKLARAVAHDFNNLMMVSIGVADIAARQKDCECCQESASSLRRSAEVGQRLIQQLLRLGARPGVNNWRSDLGEVLTRLEHPLRALLGSRIDLSILIDDPSAWVRIAETEVEQIVLNLVANARDAIPREGHVSVLVRAPASEDEVAPDCLILEVIDDGDGMDEHTRAHLFEPYFTTKAGGNGLGLATVYGIVKGVGGSVQVTSERGQGTAFRITLPRVLTAREE